MTNTAFTILASWNTKLWAGFKTWLQNTDPAISREFERLLKTVGLDMGDALSVLSDSGPTPRAESMLLEGDLYRLLELLETPSGEMVREMATGLLPVVFDESDASSLDDDDFKEAWRQAKPWVTQLPV